MKSLRWLAALGVVAATGALIAWGQAPSGTGKWDVFQTGAKGDGRTLDTAAIQRAIEECSVAGGGTVLLHNGRFLSGTIYLKSHVVLELAGGAVLLGSPNEKEYPRTPSAYPGYDGALTSGRALIYAEDAEAIGIEGLGTIDGSGLAFDQRESGGGGLSEPSFNHRPRILHFVHCERVRVSAVKLTNAGSWVECYDSCRDVVVDGITVDSPHGRNKDGLDLVDCTNVRVSNCNITCSDDGICLKSLNPDGACRDITVTNCVVSTPCTALKIGTETSGRIENVLMQNCSIHDTRDGVAIQSVDGALVENVIISNLVMRRLSATAISIRRGARNRVYRKGAKAGAGKLRGILLENIEGTEIGPIGNSITGLDDQPIENVVLRNVHLTFEGGGSPSDAQRKVEELPQAYPKGEMFGRLPSYGFFVRHAHDVRFDEVRLELNREDARPAVVASDAEGLEIDRLRASPKMTSAQAVVSDRSPPAR